MDLDCEEDYSTKEKIGREQPPHNYDINFSANEDKHGIEMHEDPEKEEFEVLEFKDNTLPRGIFPLQELFDFNDVARKPKMESTEENIEECNLGSEQEPKMIKLSNTLPTSIKQKYIALFKYFIDVFALSYEYLKYYDTDII